MTSTPIPIKRAAFAGLAVLMLTSGCGWFGRDERTATFHEGAVRDDATGVRLISAGADGTDVRFATEKDPPDAPNLDFATGVGEAVDIRPEGALPGAEVRMRADAAQAHGFIAVFNTKAGAWLPLDTRYDARAHELVAEAPHFSMYGMFLPKVVDRVRDLLAGQVLGVLRKMRDDVTGTMRLADMADCGGGRTADGKVLPGASTAVAARGWAADVQKGHAKELGVCVVEDQGARWLRVANRNGYPVVLMPPAGATDASPNDYDVRMLGDDLFLLAGRQLEAVAGHGLAGGLKSAELKVTTDGTFTVDVVASPLPIAWDVGTALLSVVLPGVPKAKVALNAAERRAIDALGGPAAGLHASRETAVNKIKDDPALRDPGQRPEQAMALLDLWSCLAKSKAAVLNVSATDAFEAIRHCVGLVAQALGREAVALGTDVLKNLKVFNEVGDFLRHAITPAVIEVRAPLRASRLGGVDWLAVAGPDLGCDSEPEMLKRPESHDITGDGVPDTFVTLDCWTSNQISPDQIRVYDGSSDPSAPALLGVLTDGAAANFHLECLTFDGKTVQTRGYVLQGADPAGVPSLLGVRSATWDGMRFRLSGLTTSAAPDGYESAVPGCD
ncbi:hypothetical protein AB0M54_28485 [Actinoplanes sp. NPDC051470]|uniref:hypothetical protein n=1 Tax=Actinoplanes sp. NPDC051470 TaxID=3157224 RepID=UPI00341BC178